MNGLRLGKRLNQQKDEVLIKVSVCGLNNTDVNTRTGWYSKNVNAPTMDTELGSNIADDPAWGGTPISFPRIQGADVCGYIRCVAEC